MASEQTTFLSRFQNKIGRVAASGQVLQLPGKPEKTENIVSRDTNNLIDWRLADIDTLKQYLASYSGTFRTEWKGQSIEIAYSDLIHDSPPKQSISSGVPNVESQFSSHQQTPIPSRSSTVQSHIPIAQKPLPLTSQSLPTIRSAPMTRIPKPITNNALARTMTSISTHSTQVTVPHSQRRWVDYKPYTQKDAQWLKLASTTKLGGLGADFDSEGYVERMQKRVKQLQYAESIRRETLKRGESVITNPSRTVSVQSDKSRKAIIPSVPTKRERMKAYAQAVPKPKITSIPRSALSDDFDIPMQSMQESEKLEMTPQDLTLRHLQQQHMSHRLAVDAIRRDLGLVVL